MANIHVEPGNVRRFLNREEDLARKLQDISEQTANIRKALDYRISGKEAIDVRLRSMIEEIARESLKLTTLREAIEQIIHHYEQVEAGNVEGADQALASVDSTAIGEDSQVSTDLFGVDNSYQYITGDGSVIMFHNGPAQRPRWEAEKDYDNYYPYDPDAKPTLGDRLEWGIWGQADLYGLVRYVPDGMNAYLHYRDGTGTPLEINYEKAYREDSVIKKHIDAHVANTNIAISQMIDRGMQPPFSITSEFIPISENPETENWQKTIGRHNTWVSAEVSQSSDGNIIVKTTVHELDRYNFNKGDGDIKTGIKDEVNGKFETYGWAKSFDTYGEISFQTNLSESNPSPQVLHHSSEGRRDK